MAYMPVLDNVVQLYKYIYKYEYIRPNSILFSK